MLKSVGTDVPKYLIGGRFGTDSSRPPMDVVNPATEEVLYQVPCCGPEHVAEALEHAQAAFTRWSAVPGWQRARVLRDIGAAIRVRRDEIARAIATEMGRPVAQAVAEVDSGAEQFTWFAGEAERLYGQAIPSRMGGALAIRPEPVGVVAGFAPWNFPFSLPIRKVAPALAAGCAIILRPSEQTPLTATILAECCLEGGLPEGVLQVLQGDPSGVSPALMASDVVRKISFTGSTRVGKLLMEQAAATVKRVSMELGGHSPVIVCPDSDVVAAARHVARVKFFNAGQVCASPNRIYVHEDIAAPFVDEMVRVAEGLVVGDPLDPEVTMGPLTGPAQMAKTERLVADALERGAVLRTGGARVPGRNAGHFFQPTVLENVPEDAQVMVEEPFGPIAPVLTWRDLDDAIARANATEYGLGAYGFTRDAATAERLSAGLQAGMVGINDMMLAHPEAPFGGVKHSGVGYESGQVAIGEYLNRKTVHSALDIPA